MFSISTAPAKQSVSETITTLSSRLSSATLLEDRRAAILGLRSFAKDYPASVASGALRSLIGSLSKDGEDVDTVKIVLETLLMLFNPNENSPEASEEIALWLADEFTQRQENITLLLDFLESTDFYSRLYSLQLVGAIVSARPERTEECILTAPLGLPRLVAVLDDPREAVRNEAITLLTYLTPASIDIQKLVAFENAFEKILHIVESDGALSEGGRTIEDCFILLANLLRRNASNQSLFRESGCVGRLTNLIQEFLKAQREQGEIAEWAMSQRNRNVYAFLAVVRLFLMVGSVGTAQNQMVFWKHGLAYGVLQLAFSPEAQSQIKAEALITSGDMIRNNRQLQEGFAQQMVSAPFQPTTEVNGQPSGHAKVYVIDGLLDLTLSSQELGAFDMRLAACDCLKAYFSNHSEVKAHFLGRAIDGYQSNIGETSNILSILLDPSTELSASDPYRLWFAAVVAFHLLYDNAVAKAKASDLTEGDASNGEEVVTCIHTVTAHLVAGLRQGDDARITIGYLMLLLGWLFEDIDAVDDFLNEGSNVQSLIQAVTRPGAEYGEITSGLCAMLLGVVYEFSTKDSPIPRATLHSILLSRLDRDKYLDRLGKLRSHPLLRDFEVTPQKLDPSAAGLLPDVFFDSVFVDFFKDNYSRISRAIDRDPELEISVVTNGVEKGISRDLVDSLRGQVEEKEHLLSETNAKIVSLERQIGQEQADHRRTRESTVAEQVKARETGQSEVKQLNVEMRKLQVELAAKNAENERQSTSLRTQLAGKESEHSRQLGQTRKSYEDQLASRDSAHQKELARVSKMAEDDMAARVSEYKNQLQQVRQDWESEKAARTSKYEADLAQARKTGDADAERIQRRTEAATADFRATISRFEVDLMKANKTKTTELQALREEHSKVFAEERNSLKEAELRCKDLEKQLQESQEAAARSQDTSSQSDLAVKQAKEARDTTQSELDDLLVVFGDLEEKVAKYKARLRKLGETVSEDEDDGEEDDSDDEDGVD